MKSIARLFAILLILTSGMFAQIEDPFTNRWESGDVQEQIDALIELKKDVSNASNYIPQLTDIVFSEKSFSSIKAKLQYSVAQHEATLLLAEIGAPAVEVVRSYMRKDETSRWKAVAILQRMGDESLPALPDLIAALDDNNEKIRYFAAKAIMELGPIAKEAVPALTRHILDPEESPRHFSIQALQEMGRHAEGALPELAKALRHRDSLTQIYTKKAINAIEADLALHPNK